MVRRISLGKLSVRSRVILDGLYNWNRVELGWNRVIRNEHCGYTFELQVKLQLSIRHCCLVANSKNEKSHSINNEILEIILLKAQSHHADGRNIESVFI